MDTFYSIFNFTRKKNPKVLLCIQFHEKKHSKSFTIYLISREKIQNNLPEDIFFAKLDTCVDVLVSTNEV